MSAHDSLKEQRHYAWSYFQLHAQQRMASFNFFVVIAALLTAGLAGTLRDDFHYHFLGIALAVGLVVVSLVFWKLDQRVRYLIKHAEDALKTIEEEWARIDKLASDDVTLFRVEEAKTNQLNNASPYDPSGWHLSYRQCFNAIYLLFGTFGVIGGIAAAIKWSSLQLTAAGTWMDVLVHSSSLESGMISKSKILESFFYCFRRERRRE